MVWISSKKLALLKETAKKLIAAQEDINERWYLLDIRRDGRINTFIFQRKTELYEIKTIGMLADDVENWKSTLIH